MLKSSTYMLLCYALYVLKRCRENEFADATNFLLKTVLSRRRNINFSLLI